MKKLKSALILSLAICLLCIPLTSCVEFIKPSGKETESDTESGDPAAREPIDWNAIDLSEYIKLPKYLGVEIDKADIDKICDDAVLNAIEGLKANNVVTEEVKDRPLAKGDTADIDFAGFIDGDYEGFSNGEQFENGTATGVPLKLGYSGYIAGFDDGIVGHKVGESFSISCTFPEDYSSEVKLRGVKVRFDIKINYATVDVVPEYNDKLVSENTEFKTTEEYSDDIRNNTFPDAKTNLVWEKIVEETEVIKYPEVIEIAVRAEEQEAFEYYAEYAVSMGMSLNDFFVANFNMTEEAAKEEIKESIRNGYLSQMIFRRIIELEEISVSDEEYEAGIIRYVEEFNFSSVEDFLSVATEEQIRDQLLGEKVFDLITDNAIVK